MTKQELLRLIRLLSALESIGIFRDTRMPDYLLEELAEMVEILEREILK
jgi:hypothetical protein